MERAEKIDLVATFMEYTKEHDDIFKFWTYRKGKFGFDVSLAKWDTDWSWLMKVVEKINGIGHCSVTISSKTCLIRINLYNINSDSIEWIGNIQKHESALIASVFEAVVEFIIKYNEYQAKKI